MKPVVVDAIGMITPGAADAAGSVGLIYTETRSFVALPRVTAQPLPITGAKTPIADDVVGVDRLVALGVQALWDAVDAELAATNIGLLVCTPSDKDEPGLAGQHDALLARLAAEARLVLAPQASRVFASGREAIFEALPLAMDLVIRSAVPAVCLLGVDSLVTPPRLKAFLESGAAFDLAPPPPGEAAAVVVLTRQPKVDALALLSGVGTSTEFSAVNAGQPNLGKGLLTAIDGALSQSQWDRPAFSVLVHDMAGGAKDYEEFAWTKTGSMFAQSRGMETIFPCVATADAGAAMGVLALATSAFLIDKRGFGGSGLCCLSSAQKRGAVVMGTAALRRPPGIGGKVVDYMVELNRIELSAS